MSSRSGFAPGSTIYNNVPAATRSPLLRPEHEKRLPLVAFCRSQSLAERIAQHDRQHLLLTLSYLRQLTAIRVRRSCVLHSTTDYIH